MKRIKTGKMICLAAIVALAGCHEEIDPTSSSDLLTSKEWKLSAHGFDANGNGTLEENENLIEDCQKDNTYLFHSNGIGQYSDNELTCGGQSSADFHWKFVDANTSLQIVDEHFSILKLNEHELILGYNLPSANITLLHYTH